MTSPADASVIALSGVGVRRGESVLLDYVDWQVAPGQHTVVLGPNGAGKTTLLHVVGGRQRATSGTVELLGTDLAGRFWAPDHAELLARIGLASLALADLIPARERALDVVLTAAYAVLRRSGEEYGEQDEQRALDLLAQWGVAALAERAWGSLSEGERRRVLLARALMSDPELLLLDEPAAGLDLGGREDLLTRLTALAADPDGPTIILVTHHVEEIPVGFDHALLLHDGLVLRAGPTRRVLRAEPLSEAFGLPLTVGEKSGRYAARALRS